MINIKNFDPNRIQKDKKLYKNYLLHWVYYYKNLSYVKITSVNASYFIFDKADGYIEESNENKYLMLLSTDKNKDTFTKV